MILPKEVVYILKRFKEFGFSSYPVGGCVRDSLLGKTPGDFDITTDATPNETLEVFKEQKTIRLGEKFGTIGVLLNENIYEITTMRYDHDYVDSRHPSSVSFTKNLFEDLKRRDFTINAMAYDFFNDEVIDPFNGRLDLEKGVIRAVGNPSKRFEEDALRIMRAFRFAGRFNYVIEEKTLSSLCKSVHLLKEIAMERIREELNKILLESNFENLRMLYNCGVFKVLFPEIDEMFKTTQNNSFHVYNVGDHSLMAVTKIKKDVRLKYVALLHDLGKVPAKTTGEDGTDHFYFHSNCSVELARDVLNRLKFSNEDKNHILKIIKFHDTVLNTKLKSIMKFVVDRGFTYDDFLDLLEMEKADISSQNPYYIDRLENLENVKVAYRKVYEGPTKLSDLAVNGSDMIEIGYKGEFIKKVLQYLLKQVIGEPKINERQKLINIADKVHNDICRGEWLWLKI